MKLERYLEEQRIKAIREGREEGRAEGRAEGHEEGRAEGREEGRAEGREEGRAEGRAEGRRANAALTTALVEAGREQELVEAMLNEDVRQRLLAEFGIPMEA